MTIEADPDVLARWPDLPARVTEAFAGRDDIDACARVQLGLREAAVEVAVVLPDGRSASRLLKRPRDVEPALAALLLVPAPLPVPESVPASEHEYEYEHELPAEGDTTSTAGVVTRMRDDLRAPAAEAPAAEPEPAGVGVEFSLVSAARTGDGKVSVGLGVLSLLDVHSSLIGFEARLEGYSGPEDGLKPALYLATLGGYRFRFGTMALDIAAGPALAMVAAQVSEAVAPMPDLRARDTLIVEEDESEIPLVPRLAIAAHYHFVTRSLFRSFVGIDGQFGPAHPPWDDPRWTDPLPTWGVGLVLGATVGTR